MPALAAPPLSAIRAARRRLTGRVLRAPLVRFSGDPGRLEDRERERARAGPAPAGIHLKLENLQATGSFKLRGAANALLAAEREDLERGVWTASAGNMGQALAWCARELGLACRVIVPDDAPRVKVQAIERLGGEPVALPFAEYQAVQREGGRAGMAGLLVHPFADQAVMAGNGTIGLEILEDLPQVQTVLVPYGGGGLACGIAAAVKALRPAVRVEAVEIETATPLAASLAAGAPVAVPYRASFVSGMGAPSVFPQMWPLARDLLDGARVVSLSQVAAAMELLAAGLHVIAEGAGAAALAAALAYPGDGPVACVVSGGNIALPDLLEVLRGARA